MPTAEEEFTKEDTRSMNLLFRDKARFGRILELAYCWVPKRLSPVLHTQIVREYTHVFSTVGPHGGHPSPLCNMDAIEMSFHECSEHFNEYRVYGYSKLQPGAGAKTWESIKSQLSYLPELNSVEHLWEYTRENYLRNHVGLTLEVLQSMLENILESIMECAETISEFNRASQEPLFNDVEMASILRGV